MGLGIFKMFKLIDGSFKPLNVALGKRDPACVVSQQWVPSDPSDNKERLLLGTNDGEVIIMEVGMSVMMACNNAFYNARFWSWSFAGNRC